MKISLFIASWGIVGCSHSPDAPVQLAELAAKTFGDQEDAALLSEDLAQLASWEAARDEVEDGYILPPLSDSAVTDITTPPGTSRGDTLGGIADAQSTATLQQHVDFILLPDQTVVDPEGYSTFARTFIEGGDCFGDGSCDRLVTENDMVKTAAGVTIPYYYFKDYQRTTYVDADGVEHDAVVSRGWIEEEGWSADGANGVIQSYTLDVFMDTSAGSVHRTQALWTEAVLVIDSLGQQFLENQLILGLQGVFADTDSAIIELGL